MPTTALQERPSSHPPLFGCPRFATSDPDEAVQGAAKVLSPHQIEVRGDRKNFRAEVNWVDLRSVSLRYLNYQNPLSFYCVPQDMYVAVILPLTGDMGISFENGELIDVPCGSFAVVPCGRRVELLYRTAFSKLVLFAKTSALSAGLRRIAPEAEPEGLQFDDTVAISGRLPSTFRGLSGLLVDIVDRYDSPTLIPANVADAMSDQVLSTFLLGLPHSRSEQLMHSSDPIASRVVKRAVECIVSDTYAQKSVTDIAVEVGVSIRALELGFRKELNCTPHAYLQRFRIERVRDQLRLARPGDGTTVTDAAVRWGFNHTGRFAALYKQTFGVMPSETLRDG